MAVVKVSDKVVLKWDKELVELHKRVLKTYLTQWSVSASTKKKFFTLYQIQVNEKNIRCWFFFPVDLFIKLLLYNQLEEMKNYEFIKTKKRHARRNKAK